MLQIAALICILELEQQSIVLAQKVYSWITVVQYMLYMQW